MSNRSYRKSRPLHEQHNFMMVSVVPALVACLFTFGCAGVLYTSLCSVASQRTALVSACLLLGTPFFVYTGAHQYADLPLAYFYLSCFAILCLSAQTNFPVGRFVAAAVFAGFASWTKSEGILLPLALFSLLLITRLRRYLPYFLHLFTLSTR